MATPPPVRRSASAPPPPSRKKTWLLLGGVVLVLAGAAVGTWLLIADSSRHHEIELAWPKSAPTGDPVRVAYDVKAGDVFVTTVASDAQFVLSTEDQVSVASGMYLKVGMTLGHLVEDAGNGALRSTVKAYLDRATSDVPDLSGTLRAMFGDRENPFTVLFDRGGDRRPVRSSVRAGDEKVEIARTLLSRALSGLSDFATNFLPARDVRLGEAWDLSEVADVPGAQEVVHYIARTQPGGGFPAPVVRGAVAAEALEERDGEPCLRLRLVWSLEQHGEVVRPAREGHVTTAAVLEGNVWVSRNTGIVRELDVRNRLVSSYLTPNLPTERKGQGRITWKTVRADKMPE